MGKLALALAGFFFLPEVRVNTISKGIALKNISNKSQQPLGIFQYVFLSRVEFQLS